MTYSRKRPWWLGAAVVLIGAVWLYEGGSMPQIGGYAALGPGFFVSVIGGALIVLGLVLLFQIARGEDFTPQEAENVEADAGASRPALLWAAAGAALPLLTMQPLGFPLTAMGSFALVTRAFGSRRLVFDCAIGLVLGLVCWFGFSKLGVGLGGLFPPAGW
ncbi:Tripartite tricarboxylate transporter TctB family protein [Pigmentiphaga humi]|uniref:Tripartite tricarboxylate transporter TctB family protein n=1 Tax=Pigmentiphaga humi TaxID=2478468 RepID=A0A3P4B4L8_9BURK|nr:tripartite tricarboxylate transporter TctB family protein [Pigmentiphaga humi]VCU71223.1 Tripartite tricarboxylate transporter TctB family protein [Pigmentiphaga humi]